MPLVREVKMRRYDLKPSSKFGGEMDMVESDGGDWVRYEDVEALATPESGDGDDLLDAMNTLRAIALSVNNGDALGHLTSYRYRIRQKLLAETNAAPQGVKTVPVFPTEEMQIAGAKAAGEGFASGYIVGIYKAMVHAAPQEASPSHYDCTSLPDCPICGGGGKGCGACDCTGKVGWPK